MGILRKYNRGGGLSNITGYDRNYASGYNFSLSGIVDPAIKDTPETPATPALEPLNIEKWEGEALKEEQKIAVGKDMIRITSPYGPRKLPGRAAESHSTGIDLTTQSGNALAFADGVIVKVALQGSGNRVGTDKKEAGYFVEVKHEDGTIGQYMHLDPMSSTEQRNLLNKKVKRGDKLWGYTTGSGSMTNPHVKFRVYDPTTGLKPSKSHIDPTAYILGLINKEEKK